MVKIGVLTEKGQFLIFDLTNDQLIWSMIPRVQLHHFDLITWFKTLQVHWIDILIFQSTDQKSTVYWKVKLWLFSIQLNFDQLTEQFICQSNGLAIFWTMLLGQNDAIWLLRSCLKPIDHLLGQKIRNYPFPVKTLILTIFPIWRFNQISWGIMVQTWSNDRYEFKMLVWIKNYEVLL